MAYVRSTLVAACLWLPAACGDGAADHALEDGGPASRDDAGALDRADAAPGDAGGEPERDRERCIDAASLDGAPREQLPPAPAGGACGDVGVPALQRCLGAWCLDAPRTPFTLPVAIGGSSSRDVWMLSSRGELAHLGCSGWTALQAPLPSFPGCMTPARQQDCEESARDDEDEEGPRAHCAGSCQIAVRSPDEAWISTEGPLFQFNGVGWSVAEPPDGMQGGRVSATADGQVWLTGGAAPPARAFRRESSAWVSYSTGVLEALPVPIDAIAADAPDNVWASSSTGLLHFTAEGWTLMASERPRGSSLLVLATGAVWLGGSTLDVERMAGEEVDVFDVQGDVAEGGAGEVWAFPASGPPQRFDGDRFVAEPHPRVESDFVQSGFGGYVWVADESAGVSYFAGGAWRFALDGDDLSGRFLKALHGSDAQMPWGITEHGEILRRGVYGWKLLHSLDLEPRPFEPDACCGNSTPEGVFVRGEDDAWFFGERGRTRTVLAHWDGHCFREHTLPDHAVAEVYAAAPDAAWAVGTAIFAWDGTGWSEQDVLGHLRPDVEATTVWGAGRDEVWVGGGESLNIDLGAGQVDPEPAGWIARWDGAQWSFLDLPVGTSIVRKIVGSGADDVWVLTWRSVLHWDGRAFTDVTPADAANLLFSTAELVGGGERERALLCFEADVRVWSGETWAPDPELMFCPAWAPSLDEMWSISEGQVWQLRR